MVPVHQFIGSTGRFIDSIPICIRFECKPVFNTKSDMTSGWFIYSLVWLASLVLIFITLVETLTDGNINWLNRESIASLLYGHFLFLSRFYCSVMNFPFKMLAWNIRGGLGRGRKQRFLRFFNRNYGFSFLGIVETKRECIDEFLIRKLWVNSDFDFSFVPSVGLLAGLCLIWIKTIIFNQVV